MALSHLKKNGVKIILGEGTFGKVTLGIDPDGTLLAIKTCKYTGKDTEHTKRKRYTRIVAREVSMLRFLSEDGTCPHMVKFVSNDHDPNGCIVIKMEYAGVNLYETYKNGFRYPEISVQIILKAILEFLAWWSSKKYIHADIKSENVFIKLKDCQGHQSVQLLQRHLVNGGTDFEIVVGDYGNFKKPGEIQSSWYVQSRYYRAPEIVEETSATPAIDLWSTGTMAAELLTASVLFPAKSGRLWEFHNKYLKNPGKNLSSFFEDRNVLIGPITFEVINGLIQPLESRITHAEALRLLEPEPEPEPEPKPDPESEQESEQESEPDIIVKNNMFGPLLRSDAIDPMFFTPRIQQRTGQKKRRKLGSTKATATSVAI